MIDQTLLYETIFKRKSVRKFDLSPLSKEHEEHVKKGLEQLRPLFDIPYEIHSVNSEEMGSMFAIKAPHYLLFYSYEQEGALLNAGYLLQQLDLYFSSQKIGGCWLGMAKPQKHVSQDKKMNFVIAYAYGIPAEAYYREQNAFKRKALEDIAMNVDQQIAQAVRLAPSATNSQPWFLKGQGDVIDVYRTKNSLLKGIVLDRMNQIDMGIALCHLTLALHDCKLAYRLEPLTESLSGFFPVCRLKKEDAHECGLVT